MSPNGLYIQHFSVHGLVRGTSPELGRDADTGGQVKYVLELTKSLADHPDVDRVDLLTRLIVDKTVSRDYSRTPEPLNKKSQIIRLQCGGRKYIRKELLWTHLDEFVDKTLKYIKSMGRIPDIFHGHYPDGGYIARELASIFGAPFIFTGHSMGRHKKDKLIADGMSPEDINRRYHIDFRIDVEERIIKEAEQIITSTNHEIKKQYGLYDNYSTGRYNVIPPGIDIKTFYPYYDTHLELRLDDETSKQAHMALLHELHRFWVRPDKPFILALCRPDQRKNIAGLVTAYGEDKDLQAIANLAIFAGIRKNITVMEENERNVLTEMLLLMDRYDLYGKMAIPKKHDFTIEVPELYRLCADSHGVFVNPALVEPFGITLIEAASTGLPIIATRDGGPADIIRNCENGLLIDPTSSEEIAAACKKLLVDPDIWKTYSSNGINGVRSHYAWESHCEKYIGVIKKVIKYMPEAELASVKDPKSLTIGHRLTSAKRLLITDIDNTLVGDESSLKELLDLLKANQDSISWGVATGRSLEMTLDALEKNKVPIPDIIICSVGTEIFYGPHLTPDKGWQQHLAYKWNPGLIKNELKEFDMAEIQEPESQTRFKISYYINPEEDPEVVVKVHQTLQAKKIRYNLVYSLGQYLDILPFRASKAKAVRYLSYKWELPLPNIMVCGDSGKDKEMLRGDTRGVIVGNHSDELESLKGLRGTYFSKQEYAAGILDGINHYRFLEYR